MKTLISLLCTAIFLFGCVHEKSGDNVRCQVTPFELSDITLLDGPFKNAAELSKKSLFQYEPDRFLTRFRSKAGLEAKAEAYGGWEAETIAGHSLGHYLSGCALISQSTGTGRLFAHIIKFWPDCGMLFIYTA